MKAIQLSGNQTKEILRSLIYKEFHKYTEPWEQLIQLELIETAKHYGLTELAEELKNDIE